MKKKRGFTLIEIIICIVLISLIGTVSIVVVNKNDDKTLSKTTKKILEAANVYIETEKDKDGNTYAYGINNGGKGVTIPLKELVNSGYVSEKDSNEVKDLTKLENDDKYFVLLANNTDLCETGSVLEIASWNVDSDKGTLYLCDNVTKPEESKMLLSEYILKYHGVNGNTVNSELHYEAGLACEDHYYAVENAYHYICLSGTSYNVSNQLIDGLIHEFDEYVYTGIVNNNYVSIDGKTFRIVKFNENELRLIGSGLIINDSTEDDLVYKGLNGYKNLTEENSYLNKSIKNYLLEIADNLEIPNDKIYNFFNQNAKFTVEFYNKPSASTTQRSEYSRFYGLLSRDELNSAGNPIFNEISTYYLIDSYLNYSGDASVNTMYDGAWCYGELSNCLISTPYSTFSHTGNLNRYNFGKIEGIDLSKKYIIRPVVVLNMEHISFTGNGSIENPFVIDYKD